MYSENQRHNSSRRANDEFLRRMLGGEMSYGNADRKERREDGNTHENTGCSCNRRLGTCGDTRESTGCGGNRRLGTCGDTRESTGCGGNRRLGICGATHNADVVGSSCPLRETRNTPACNDGDRDNGVSWGCSKHRSLAMVYSPVQSFQNIYELEKALSRGTLFAELDLPFEGCERKEACAHRCDR